MFDVVSSKGNSNLKITKFDIWRTKRLDYRNQVKLQIHNNELTKEELKGATYKRDVYGDIVKNEKGEPLLVQHFPNEAKARNDRYLTKTNVEMLLEARDKTRALELMERAQRRGLDTFEATRDTTYKKNYLTMFKDKYQNMDGFEEVYDELNSIDERDFKDYMQKIDPEGYNNFREGHYNNPFAQAEFNTFADRLDVAVNQGLELVTEEIY